MSLSLDPVPGFKWTSQWKTWLSNLRDKLVSQVATLTGTEILTNKTLTSPDINGGTIDGTTIGASTAAAGTFTTAKANEFDFTAGFNKLREVDTFAEGAATKDDLKLESGGAIINQADSNANGISGSQGAYSWYIAANRRMWMETNGSLVVGAPTGGAKGVGTINAQAVYDDNTLLTDYVFDAEIDGDVDTRKWDDLVPDRGKEVRTHGPARRFKASLDELDPTTYTAKWKQLRKLPAFARGSEKKSLGEYSQALLETCEVQAIHIDKLEQRIAALEAIIK